MERSRELAAATRASTASRSASSTTRRLRPAELLADGGRGRRTSRSPAARRPARAYELAAELEPDWSGAHVWLGDERCVPPDDERSNYRLAKRDAARPARARSRRCTGSAASSRAEEAAELVRRRARRRRARPGAERPRPRRPHRVALPRLAGARRARAARGRGQAELEPFVARVTMTLPVFARRGLLVFLVTGADKAERSGARSPTSRARRRRRAWSAAGGRSRSSTRAAASLLPQG